MPRRHAMNNGTAVAAAVRTSNTVTQDRIRPTARAIDHRANFFALALAATPINVTRSRHDLGDWLQTLTLEQDQIDEILLAVSEAVTNAIEHGSSCDESKRISLQTSVRNGAVTAIVKDTGRWIPVHCSSASPSDRGRGLILIRQLADHVDIADTAEGTEIMMRFDASENRANQANAQ